MSKHYVPKAIFFDGEKLLRDTTVPSGLPDEYQFVRLFLLSYRHSKDTYNTYRREIERFCQWLWFVKKTTLAQCDREDLTAYIAFFQSPPATWCGSSHVPRYIMGELDYGPNPAWRPFVVKIGKQRMVSPAGMKSLIACLSTFFAFLIQENLCVLNPVKRLTQKKQFIQSNMSKRIKRRLSHTQWRAMIIMTQEMANQNPKYERQLYLLSLFYLLGLRISEVAQGANGCQQMNAFYQDPQKRWWFEAYGKGNKIRDVAVPDSMLLALSRYRKTLGLSELPDATDHTPLIPKHRGSGGLSARQIRALVSEIFQHTIDVFIREGKPEDAESLKHATVHWLRHTAISDDVMHRSPEHVRDDVGHENIATTSLYIDVLDDQRHQSAKYKPLLPEE